jgi:lambda repressor-like predicted transcriptional regulator
MKNSTRKKLLAVFDGSRTITGADRCWALVIAGTSQAALADKIGVSRPAMCDVLHDQRTSYNIASAVAEATGLTLKRLWPCGKYHLSPAERRALASQQKQAA